MLPLTDADVSATCFVATHPRLARYITTYYFTTIQSRDGQPVEDTLHPEWGSFRFFRDGDIVIRFVGRDEQSVPPHIMHGPTSLGGRFSTYALTMGGFGLLPLGWYRLVQHRADDWSNTVKPAMEAVAHFDMAALIRDLDDAHDPQAAGAVFDHYLLAALDNSPCNPLHEDKITEAHAALVDPAVMTVADLMERLDLSSRTTIRLCRAVFGFPPKQLLRRQRFVCTLEVVMRDWDQHWSNALDGQYYDMSHFHRDFRAIFGETPQQYLRKSHPVIKSASLARTLAMGAPLQALDLPRLV